MPFNIWFLSQIVCNSVRLGMGFQDRMWPIFWVCLTEKIGQNLRKFNWKL